MKIEIEGTVPQAKPAFKLMTLGEVKAAGQGVFVRVYEGKPFDDTGIVNSKLSQNALVFFGGHLGSVQAFGELTWNDSAVFVRLLDGAVTVHSDGSVTVMGSQYEMEPAVEPKVYTVEEARREPGLYREPGDWSSTTLVVLAGCQPLLAWGQYVSTSEDYGEHRGLHKLENAKVTITG